MKLVILAACVCLAMSAPVQERGLLDTLSSLTDGTKLGSAMKVLDAFSKVSSLISDLKNIAPEAHKALSSSIEDIKKSMGNIVTGITGAVEGQTKSVHTRGLLDTLSSLTDGTKLGSAMKVLDAFSKVSSLISDLKNIAPEAHKALSSSIEDIKKSMGSIVTGITGAVEGQTKSVHTRGLLDTLSSLTDGTKLGSAMKVLDAFSKVSSLISDLKNIAPEAHKALSSSIEDIKKSMGSIVTGITGAVEGQTKSVHTRGLLDTLSSLTDGTKLGSAMKVLDAFSKVSSLISDLKNIAPEAHKALSSSIEDIKKSMGNIVTGITGAVEGQTKSVHTRGLLDTLSSLTDGTKLGSAMKVLDAFSKVSSLISDLKNIAPEAHKALSSSIEDIKKSMGNIVTGITGAVEGQTKSVHTRGLLDTLSSLTDGTKLGSAMKVLDAFSKVSSLISDLKNIAPEAHKALSSSIEDIKKSMGNIVTGITGAVEGQTKSVHTRGLLDTLSSLTDGTKLGSAMKVLDAFSKVSSLISDLKNIAPEAHKALSSSIEDIKKSMGNIVTGITGAVEGQTKSVHTRGLLDTLSSLTDGTKLGSAMKVLDAFSKVSSLISDLKNIAPEAHKALSSSIKDIENTMGGFVTDITKAVEHQ